jgi:5'-hydroxyaverantin dehydrogenase
MPPPRRTVDVNYLGVYNTVHAAMYYFKNFPGEDISKTKLIVLVASMGGFQPMATVVDYNSSKWGVRGMFWSLRNVEAILGEGKPGFRVNLIAPTWVRTNMTRGIQSRIEESQSTIKVAEVSDCVDVVLRMASDENVKGTWYHFFPLAIPPACSKVLIHS